MNPARAQTRFGNLRDSSFEPYLLLPRQCGIGLFRAAKVSKNSIENKPSSLNLHQKRGEVSARLNTLPAHTRVDLNVNLLSAQLSQCNNVSRRPEDRNQLGVPEDRYVLR